MSNATCPWTLPYSWDYLEALSVTYIVLYSVLGVLTLIVVALYIETLIYLFTHLHNWKPRDKAKWLLAVYPIMCITSGVAIIFPRSASFNDMVSSSYLASCIYLFVTMLIGHYGGVKKMMVRLNGVKMKINKPPFFCCCPCLPTPDVTPRKLQLLETSVLQYALFRPITAYIASVLWANGNHTTGPHINSPAAWLAIFNLLSTMVAVYGFNIVYSLSEVPLSKTAVKPKFLCLQLVLLTSGVQKAIISMIAFSGAIPCDPPLSVGGNVDRWHNMLVIVEMFLINIFARKYYRRHVSYLPTEDRIDVEKMTCGTGTTDSLTRGLSGTGGFSFQLEGAGSLGNAGSISTVARDYKYLVRRSPSKVSKGSTRDVSDLIIVSTDARQVLRDDRISLLRPDTPSKSGMINVVKATAEFGTQSDIDTTISEAMENITTSTDTSLNHNSETQPSMHSPYFSPFSPPLKAIEESRVVDSAAVTLSMPRSVV